MANQNLNIDGKRGILTELENQYPYVEETGDSVELGSNVKVLVKGAQLLKIGSRGVVYVIPPPLPMIAAGLYHSLYVEYVNNQTWTWGNNIYGQLGDNSTLSKRTPVSILGAKKTFCSISAGNHSLGVDFRGQVWTWGYNLDGQLGDNTTTSRRTPVSILGAKKTFCSIAGGDTYSLGIDLLGQVWGWGDSYYGVIQTQSSTPTKIGGTGKTFCQINTKMTVGILLDNYSQVWCWGSNLDGAVGNNSATPYIYTPVSIHGAKKTFCSIAGGGFHNMAIDYVGQVWGWGLNTQGQIGDNTTTSRRTPVSILGAKKTFCSISGGGFHNMAIDYVGQVWTWGYNINGQLGDNSVTNRCTPVSILGAKKTFCSILGGRVHSLGIDFRGQVWTWGNNNNGQLGDNTTTSRRTPVRVCNL